LSAQQRQRQVQRLGGLFREPPKKLAQTPFLAWFALEMATPLGDRRMEAPSAERNKAPILLELKKAIRDLCAASEPSLLRVLLVAEGAGVHCDHFVREEPMICVQPTDSSEAARDSQDAFRALLPETARARVLPAADLDVREEKQWAALGEACWDIVVSINMIHIAPPACTAALLLGASRALRPGGRFLLYGPFLVDGRPTTDSNAAFDAKLKAMDPSFGLRDVAHVETAALDVSLKLLSTTAMPANNLTLVFEKA
jgi:SAM-dependent methyltransferase